VPELCPLQVLVWIVAIIDLLQGLFFKKLGNGSSILFWSVVLVGTVPLKDIYPRLFQVSEQKIKSLI
jgi:hypothetical protein